MIAKLFSSLTRPAAPLPIEAPLALAAIMVRLARADGDYAPDEIARIDLLLASQFGLDPETAQATRRKAEGMEAEAVDTVRFTRAIKDAVPLEARHAVLARLWSVVLTDGARDQDEDALMRLISSLLGLSDVESAQARQWAAAQS